MDEIKVFEDDTRKRLLGRFMMWAMTIRSDKPFSALITKEHFDCILAAHEEIHILHETVQNRDRTIKRLKKQLEQIKKPS